MAILRSPRYAGAYIYGRTRSMPAHEAADPPEPAFPAVAGAATGGALGLHRLAGVSAQPRHAGPQPGRDRLRRRLRVAYGNVSRHGSKAYYLCQRGFPQTGLGTCLSLPAS